MAKKTSPLKDNEEIALVEQAKLAAQEAQAEIDAAIARTDEKLAAQAEPAKTPARPPKLVDRILKVELTEHELMEHTETMLDAMRELDAAENDLAQFKSSCKARTDTANAKISGERILLNTKLEFRTVTCEEILDFATGKFRIVRCDTGKVIEERDLMAHERQQELPLEEEADTIEAVATLDGDPEQDKFFADGSADDGVDRAGVYWTLVDFNALPPE